MQVYGPDEVLDESGYGLAETEEELPGEQDCCSE